MSSLNVKYKLVLHNNQVTRYADIVGLPPSLESNNMLTLLRCCKNVFSVDDNVEYGYIVAYKTTTFKHIPVAVFALGRTSEFDEKQVAEQWDRDYSQLFDGLS